MEDAGIREGEDDVTQEHLLEESVSSMTKDRDGEGT